MSIPPFQVVAEGIKTVHLLCCLGKQLLLSSSGRLFTLSVVDILVSYLRVAMAELTQCLAANDHTGHVVLQSVFIAIGNVLL